MCTRVSVFGHIHRIILHTINLKIVLIPAHLDLVYVRKSFRITCDVYEPTIEKLGVDTLNKLNCERSEVRFRRENFTSEKQRLRRCHLIVDLS